MESFRVVAAGPFHSRFNPFGTLFPSGNPRSDHTVAPSDERPTAGAPHSPARDRQGYFRTEQNLVANFDASGDFQSTRDPGNAVQEELVAGRARRRSRNIPEPPRRAF